MNRVLLWVVAGTLLWLPPVLAKNNTLMLISTAESNGNVSFWWRCDAQPQPVMNERIGAILTEKKNPAVFGCKAFEAPPHRSYHRAQLRSYQQYNLANTAGAKRLIAGQLQYQTHEAVADLGLFHQSATLTLTSYDVQSERQLGTISVRGDGFGHTASATRKQVDNAILSQLNQQKHNLLAKAPVQFAPKLRIRVDGLHTPGQLTTIMETIRAVTGVRKVLIDQLRRATAVLRIEPQSARSTIEGVLQSLAPDCVVTILP